MNEALKQIWVSLSDGKAAVVNEHWALCNGGDEYTRTDLCVTPSEAEALRAENMALRGAYEQGLRDAALACQQNTQAEPTDVSEYDEGWVDGSINCAMKIMALLGKQEQTNEL